MARLRYTKDKSGPISVQMPPSERQLMATKPGLYAAIHAKRARIAAGSGEKMRKPGTKGAPTAAAFRKSAKTRKK